MISLLCSIVNVSIESFGSPQEKVLLNDDDDDDDVSKYLL
jgi:hypothetical protein